MSLAIFSQSKVSLSLKNTSQQSISKIIFINSDNLMILRVNSQYQIYQIRSGQKLSEGSIPNLASCFKEIKPLNSKLDCVYIHNHTSIYKLHYKQNIWEVQDKVYPFPSYNQNKENIEYRALDQEGDYLIGIIKSYDNMSSTIFVYDWKFRQFSNLINLGTNFFNMKLTNLQEYAQFSQFKNGVRNLKISFAAVSDEERKIFYNYLTFQINPGKQLEDEDSTLKRSMILNETGKRNVALTQDYTVIFSYLTYPIVYGIANSHKDGPTLLRIHMEQAACRKILLYQNSNSKKIVRKVFGVIGHNIGILTQNVGEQVQWLYGISLPSIMKVEPSTNKLYLQLISPISAEGDIVTGFSVRRVQNSLDGNSLFSYRFERDSVAKICLKENPEFESKLLIQTVFKIPKKFLYFELCNGLEFSCSMIEETLKVL